MVVKILKRNSPILNPSSKAPSGALRAAEQNDALVARAEQHFKLEHRPYQRYFSLERASALMGKSSFSLYIELTKLKSILAFRLPNGEILIYPDFVLRRARAYGASICEAYAEQAGAIADELEGQKQKSLQKNLQ